MINEKNNMRTEALFSDDKAHRYLLKKSWDNNKPSVSIIMISPSSRANDICVDMTSMYVVNNCVDQGFGSVEILNLYSKLDENSFDSCKENDEQILKSCQRSDRTILAWGRGQAKKMVDNRIEDMMKLLEPYKDKLYEIADIQGRKGLHPLGASVRLCWHLVPYQYPHKEVEASN